MPSFQRSWRRRLVLLFSILALVIGCDDQGPDPEVEGDEPGECNDGADNDDDGLVDCEDSGCDEASACSSADGDADSDSDGDADGDVCLSNVDCDDGAFCNGEERCDPDDAEADDFGCLPAESEPCLDDQECDEAEDRCLRDCEVEPDADGDGHDSIACGGDDCDDSDVDRFPGNTEVCDAEGHDEDCNPLTLGPDGDGDGYISEDCANLQSDGSRLEGQDCNDSSAEINPEAPESCNEVDDDCDGEVDEGVEATFFRDADRDGHGDPDNSLTGACIPPEGYVTNSSDCDDTEPAVNPGAPEVCDGLDNDCDGDVDDGVGATFYHDGDHDLHGDPDDSLVACSAPEDYVTSHTDCDDTTGAVHPGHAEICDGLDNDCDGEVDEETSAVLWYIDEDGDGFGNDALEPILSCTPVPDRVTHGGDCDDHESTVRPGQVEFCDDLDNNCDSIVDEGDNPCGGACPLAEEPETACDGDDTDFCIDDTYVCDGLNAIVCSTGTDDLEECNGFDDDCDGIIDDGSNGCGGACDLLETPGSSCDGDDSDLCIDDTFECDGLNNVLCSISDDNVEICGNGVDDDCDSFTDVSIGTNIGDDLRVSNSVGASSSAKLVWTGSDYGVVWQDSRHGEPEIYFARVSSTGAALGAEVRITNDPGISRSASLVWTGTEFAIAWEDDRDGNFEIYFTRADADGTKIGDDVRVTNAAGFSRSPSLAWTGSEFGIAWYDERDDLSPSHYTEIYFTRLSSGGVEIGEDTRITESGWGSMVPHMVWNGTEFGIVWHDSRTMDWEIYFTRISSAGAQVGGDVRLTDASGESSYSAITWTGEDYGVAWHDRRTGSRQIWFARVSSTGSLIGSDLQVTSLTGLPGMGSVVWNGAEFAIPIRDNSAAEVVVTFARISTIPAVVAMGSVSLTAASVSAPSLVWREVEYGMAWPDDRDGDSEVYFTRVGGCY